MHLPSTPLPLDCTEMGCDHTHVPAFAWLGPVALRDWGKWREIPKSKFTELTRHKWRPRSQEAWVLLHLYRNSLWVTTDLPFGWFLLAWSSETFFLPFLLCLQKPKMGLVHSTVCCFSFPLPNTAGHKLELWEVAAWDSALCHLVSHFHQSCGCDGVNKPISLWLRISRKRTAPGALNLPRAELPLAEHVTFLGMLLGRTWAALSDPQPHTQHQLLTNYSIKTTPAAVSHRLPFQNVIWKPRAVLSRRGRSHLHAGKPQASLCSPVAAAACLQCLMEM